MPLLGDDNRGSQGRCSPAVVGNLCMHVAGPAYPDVAEKICSDEVNI